MLDREAAILRRLTGSISPALLDEGIWEGRRYLLLEWCDGVDAATAAAGLRRDQSAEAPRKLFGLCCHILRAYSRLHGQGVIHSDIHPRNILVDQEDQVRIVDFGLARMENLTQEFGEPPRGGVGFFFEPEYAAAVVKGQTPPLASRLGEQYALAALLYSLLADAQYVDFSLTKDAMMRQIVEAPPVPFAERGMASWPEAESILAKALSKSPSERFVSVTAFADALSACKSTRERLAPASANRECVGFGPCCRRRSGASRIFRRSCALGRDHSAESLLDLRRRRNRIRALSHRLSTAGPGLAIAR